MSPYLEAEKLFARMTLDPGSSPSTMAAKRGSLAYPFPSNNTTTFVPPPIRRAVSSVDIGIYDFLDTKIGPPTLYATSRSTPTSLPILLSPQLPKLAALDEASDNAPPRRIEDLEQEFPTNPASIQEVEEWLDEFIEAKRPYVQLTSARLHAVLGMKNESAFDLNQTLDAVEFPQAMLLSHEFGRGVDNTEQELKILQTELNGKTANTSDKPPDASILVKSNSNRLPKRRSARLANSRARLENPMKEDVNNVPRNNVEALIRHNITTRILSGWRPPNILKRAKEIHAVETTMLPEVDRKSGAGLREFLHTHTDTRLVRKRECYSITFCDFIKEGDKLCSNSILGHWTADRKKSRRIEAYELDLPCPTRNPSINGEELVMQRWIFILLSRPVLTVEPKLTSAATSNAEKAIPSERNIEALYKLRTTQDSTTALPPASFPRPIPTSWLVFACPLDNTTPHTETREKSSSKTAMNIQKRQDFDFSHHGIPIFEFSSKQNLPWPAGLDVFLSDDEKSSRDNFFGVDDFPGNSRFKNGSESPVDTARWEAEFFKAVEKDRQVWEDIRSAMTGAKCRIVIKWNEYLPREEREKMHVAKAGRTFEPYDKSTNMFKEEEEDQAIHTTEKIIIKSLPATRAQSLRRSTRRSKLNQVIKAEDVDMELY